MKNWDNSSTIRLRRQFQINPDIASLDLGIEKDELRLSLGVRIGTGSGRLPMLIVHRESHEFEHSDQRIDLEIEVPGDGLSIVLDLVAEVTLAISVSNSAELSPARIGDRLWQDRQRIRLEGEEARFPIEVADFSILFKNLSAVSAPWYIHWSPTDWSRDFHGAIRVFLNCAYPELIERIVAQDTVILQALLADVMSQVCERLVNEEDAVELIEPLEPGSLGAQAMNWLNRAWPNYDIGSIRSILENRPGTFRATFLALAELQNE